MVFKIEKEYIFLGKEKTNNSNNDKISNVKKEILNEEKQSFLENVIDFLEGRMSIGDRYNKDSKMRKYNSIKHSIYRKLFINPELKAFYRQCSFCLTELSNDSVYAYSCLRGMDENIYRYYESHKCPCCGQKWEYFNISSSEIIYKNIK